MSGLTKHCPTATGSSAADSDTTAATSPASPSFSMIDRLAQRLRGGARWKRFLVRRVFSELNSAPVRPPPVPISANSGR